MSRSKNSVILSIGRVVALSLNLLTTLLLARLLTVSEYGYYQQVWLVYLVVSPVFSAGLPASILYFFPNLSPENQKTIVFQTATLLMGLGCVLSLISILFGGFVFSENEISGEYNMLLYFAFYPIFSLPIIFFDSLLIVLKKAKDAVLFTVYFAVIHFVSVLLPSFLDLGLEMTFVSISIGGLINFAIVYIYLFNYFKGTRFNWSKTILKDQLNYSIPLALSSIIGTLNRRIDFVMISFIFSVETFAIYSAGAFEIPIVGVVVGVIVSITIPEFVKLYHQRNFEEIIRIWKSSIAKVSLIFFPLFLFLLVSAKDFITLLFTDKFEGSHIVFMILIFTLPLRVANYGSLLQTAGKTRFILKISIMTLVANGVFNLVFIYFFGFYGAAVSTVLSMYVMGFLQLHKSGRLMNIRLAHMMPFKRLATVMLFAMAPLIAIYPLQLVMSETNILIRFIVSGFLYGLLYVLITMWLSPMKMEIKDLIFDLLKRKKRPTVTEA